MLDRRMPGNVNELVVQDLNLGVNLLQRGIIEKHDRLPLVNLAVSNRDIQLTYPLLLKSSFRILPD